jgi:hypothetical protein
MDHLNAFLASAALNDEYLPSIQASATIGKKLLNKYYDSTDQSEVYRISMGRCSSIVTIHLIILTIYQVLHPRHKLEYFKRAGWDNEWIATAREIVQTEFDRSYAFMEVDEPNDPEPVCAS